ncbi:hypothetical protein ACGF1Z_13650 [Streptomyces sp. NPDC048018]|uniref:hypothetical protein n=1 Tax=Streptomyces sp. NPDC048018 TaxID=3365499 RepID=UPI0037237E88
MSRNGVTAREGGHALEPPASDRTCVRLFNVREGPGLGGLLVGPPALVAARRDAEAFGARIEAAAETGIAPR